MSEGWRKFTQLVAAFLVAGFFVIWADRRYGRTTPPEIVVETQYDTLTIHDTIVAYKPVPFNVYVVDTMYVPVSVGKDTVWVDLPREAKVYQDSTYRAVVSGFRPSLDTISIYRQKEIVTVTNNVRIPPPRWSWGVQAGVGVHQGGVSPYIGVGIQYRLGDFTIRK